MSIAQSRLIELQNVCNLPPLGFLFKLDTAEVKLIIDELIEQRADRVKLQTENASLRAELARYVAQSLDEEARMAEELRPVKVEADIAALAERLARVEDRLATLEPVDAAPTASAPHNYALDDLVYLHPGARSLHGGNELARGPWRVCGCAHDAHTGATLEVQLRLPASTDRAPVLYWVHPRSIAGLAASV